MARLLVDQGSDLHQMDNMGQQCIHLAAQAGAVDTLQFVLHNAQSKGLDVNVHSTKTGATPLHLAAKVHV